MPSPVKHPLQLNTLSN